ncbi:MAG: 1-deoxy-D-xylulose-5-phosphate synthase [Oscillospiraceae bacterium]|nr:MAG: 1-deoxy-D-xylulose-5-phosphate synthase [Oscillospiraceae bacterium]
MTPNHLLPLIRNPEQLKQLSYSQMEGLCRELRQVLIDTVSQTGGHLASNLGVVELTVALLHCLSLDQDKVIWDVGHQCYSYKLLTGRADRFSTLRQEGGLSGFPKRSESAYDHFIAGHASTSLAAAYGLKRAMTLKGEEGAVVAVVGDGSFTGGMIYEGLNNIGKSGENLIVILNDNEMAISRNEGALAKYLAVIRSKPTYFKMKKNAEQLLLGMPVVGKPLRDLAWSSKTALKKVIYSTTFFEELGFAYLGPVDGHDLKSLCDVITQAKQMGCPCLIHVRTRKGKGYRFSEKNPGMFHGVSKFDAASGRPVSGPAESFSEVFGKELLRCAEQDSRICAITAAMEHGTGMQHFARRYKQAGRYYDVGIAEEFAATLAASLAAGGMLPVFAVYSTFLQRCCDQLIHDAAIEPQHLVLGIDRAGIVGDDGETHQGIFDVALLSPIPNFSLFAPSNYDELRQMLRRALFEEQGPTALRYPRGTQDPTVAGWKATGRDWDLVAGTGTTRLLVTYGRTFAAALQAMQSDPGLSVLKLNRLLPLPEEALEIARGFDAVLFAEEGIRTGGLGMQFMEKLAESGYRGRMRLHAIDQFVPQSSVSSALHRLGLDAPGLLQELCKLDEEAQESKGDMR